MTIERSQVRTLPMSNQRKIERHQLPYYLKVFNRYTDKPLGYIGNLSEDGLMLISPYPMLRNARFEMRLKVPTQDGQVRHIDLSATCQWSQEDVTPGSYDSGFQLIDPPAEILEMVDALRQYFSFQPHVSELRASENGASEPLAGPSC